MSAGNALLDMDAVRQLLGMDQAATGRLIRRRLLAVAEKRPDAGFWLGKLAGTWFTTDRDMRALVPELYAHEARGADSVRDVLADAVAELASVRRRLSAAEEALAALRAPESPAAKTARMIKGAVHGPKSGPVKVTP